MTAPGERPTVRAGLFPWLPWPLSGMRWWTESIRAERLAALRIGLALCVLADVLTSYWPNRRLFFGPGSLGTLEDFQWYAQDGKRFWSILRGAGDDLNFTLAAFASVGLFLWLVLNLRARWSSETKPVPSSLWPAIGWCAACGYCVWGYWIRVLGDGNVPVNSMSRLAMWLVPWGLAVVAGLFWAAETWLRHRRIPAEASLPRRRLLHAWGYAAGIFFPALGVVGFLLHRLHPWKVGVTPDWLFSLLEPWMRSDTMIAGCMAAWLAALTLLAAGWRTRGAAIACWVLSSSFGNVNPIIDNAGDSIRQILLFYLMLCPCGAAWSVDAWLTRKHRPEGEKVIVSPWPVRLIFVQLVLMYFLNGAYKVLSDDWREGKSLYYVLHDTTLTRFSYMELPLNYALTRWLTWSVLAWELCFPLLVLWKWPRRVALGFGVLFHLGIGLTMDLGFFVPYALCMYLPLIRWEKWAGRIEPATHSGG